MRTADVDKVHLRCSAVPAVGGQRRQLSQVLHVPVSDCAAFPDAAARCGHTVPARDRDARQLAVHVVLHGHQVATVNLPAAARCPPRARQGRVQPVHARVLTVRTEETDLARLELCRDDMVLGLVKQLDRYAERHGG